MAGDRAGWGIGGRQPQIIPAPKRASEGAFDAQIRKNIFSCDCFANALFLLIDQLTFRSIDLPQVIDAAICLGRSAPNEIGHQQEI